MVLTLITPEEPVRALPREKNQNPRIYGGNYPISERVRSGVKGGPSSAYDWGVVEEYASRMASGRSMVSVSSDSDMPTGMTMRNWRRVHPEIDDMLDRARSDRTECTRQKLIDMADAVLVDGGLDPARVNAAALALSKAENLGRPAAYRRVEVTGAGGGPVRVEGATMLEGARAIAFLLAAAQAAAAVPMTIDGDVAESVAESVPADDDDQQIG